MSENIDLTRRAYAAFNDGDIDALLALMDDDVAATPRLAAMEGAYHGHEGIRRWLEGLLTGFPDFAVEILEMSERGDRTFATVRARGHGAGSATPLDEPLGISAAGATGSAPAGASTRARSRRTRPISRPSLRLPGLGVRRREPGDQGAQVPVWGLLEDVQLRPVRSMRNVSEPIRASVAADVEVGPKLAPLDGGGGR